MQVPPYGLSGRLYGTLLNHRSALAAMGDLAQAPYQAPPQAPVLYIKPRNTLRANGEPVIVPAETAELEIGACLGIVLGRPACNVSPARALDCVAGYLIVNDVSVPHLPYFRPSIRAKARDGFCPLGPLVVPRSQVPDPDDLTIRVRVDETQRAQASTRDLVRNVAQLLADVSEFMTLSPGDVLATGAAAPAGRVRAGQRVTIEIDALGRLENPFVAETA
jgi:5-oxopent-3-ene-1,2,5-tricarboxylate decarboxylase / 2-hydroxyhepta-2,4-diene-1,7-dioate isomerase